MTDEFQFVFHPGFAGLIELGKSQPPVGFLGTGEKQDAVAQAPPRFGLWAPVIRKHHHLHAGLFCGREDFGPSSAGMIRVLRMNMNHRAIIFVAPHIQDIPSLPGELGASFVRRAQAIRGQTLDRGEARRQRFNLRAP